MTTAFGCLYVLLWLHLTICTSTSTTYSDLDALLKVKAAMKSSKAKGPALEDWKYSSSPSAHCSFSGVTCDNNSRVIHLNVSLTPMFGHLPSEIGLLDKLVNLTISQNNLTGHLPKELANLISLKYFNISHNAFNGTFPGEITLGMTELEVLDAYDNNFTGPLPLALVKLKNLRRLHLAGSYFYGEIPEIYSEIQSLEILHLNENELGGHIPASLARLKNLKELYIGYNNKYKGGIPPEFGSMESIQLIDMAECGLTGEIPPSLSSLKNMHSLFLQSNNLTGTIPPEFSSLISLKSLDLAFNELTGEIPLSFSNLKNITLFHFFHNKLEGPIPAFIGDLPNLEVLQLWGNNFTLQLPENLGRNGKLKKLDVSINHLTGPIPRDLCKGGKLEDFILMQNFFYGPIPDEIGNCKSLKKNRLVGEIPKGIKNMVDLSILNLSRNDMTGQVPDEIRFMTSLTTLDLSNNNFVGILPTGGQFIVFNDRSFSGNPDLCLPRHQYCPPSVYADEERGRRHRPFGSKSTKVIAIAIALATAMLLVLVTIYIMRKQKHRSSMAWKLTAFQRLEFKAEDVLECLKEENIIGKGGAGIVYRGSMPDGIDVAIKRLVGQGSGRNDYGFKAEIQTLGRIRHRNIVRLLGDVKSNNILLDADFEAHVADFGLAKFLQDPGASQSMSSIAGSYGYIAPEYAYTLKVDEKSDVYSFGVVLLELIVGRKPVGEFGDGVDIVGWMKKTISELSQPSDAASVLAVLDPRLSGYPLTSVIHMFKVAILCVEEEGSARPTMREVVHMLTNSPQSSPDLINL
ncbi:hypothetical protein L6164_024874 [Bauhinia variegata]|uniref:Uncharacterized protein n=1 Tax=Bauhinia variegata TaxID=167791 RepID=A0ACB9M0B3_BAUVA|nr:hypothetical protein L6164_024874 [Bauhinia variegata]